MSLRGRLTGIAVAVSLALGGGVLSAAPAQAAVYGQPGYVNCQIIRSVQISPYERRVTWECDYRTSLGVIIKDAYRYDRVKRVY